MNKRKRNAGFTLVELMVVIVLLGLVFSMAGQFINFSFLSQRKSIEEYDLQSEVRHASTVVNDAIRNSTVTFALPKDVFVAAKKDNWNYLGIENQNQIVQYLWNSTTNTHDRIVLVDARDDVFYNLAFDQENPNSSLLSFQLEAYMAGKEDQKINIQSELDALNSVAVEDGGSDDVPAVALAYREDPTPSPETQTTREDVTLAVALVLDDSGSMAFDMNGRDSWDWWRFDPYNVRVDILQAKAKALIDEFAAIGKVDEAADEGNIKVSIIPFSDDADNVGPMLDATKYKSTLKTKIDGLRAYGGTNTGDGLRRAYYVLKEYQEDYPSDEIVYYIILLTDGNPTYYSSNRYSSYDPQNDNEDCHYIRGSGQQEEPNLTYSMNYVEYIGQNLVVGRSLDIRTFVIGFTAVSSEVSRARSIAESACTHVSNESRKGTYYEATSAIELEAVFKEITTTILQETWHIYGPY